MGSMYGLLPTHHHQNQRVSLPITQTNAKGGYTRAPHRDGRRAVEAVVASVVNPQIQGQLRHAATVGHYLQIGEGRPKHVNVRVAAVAVAARVETYSIIKQKQITSHCIMK